MHASERAHTSAKHIPTSSCSAIVYIVRQQFNLHIFVVDVNHNALHNAHHHYYLSTIYGCGTQWYSTYTVHRVSYISIDQKLMMNAKTHRNFYTNIIFWCIYIIYYTFRNKRKKKCSVSFEMEPIKCIYLGFFFSFFVFRCCWRLRRRSHREYLLPIIIIIITMRILVICWWWWMVMLARVIVSVDTFLPLFQLSHSSLSHSLSSACTESYEQNECTRAKDCLFGANT